MIKKFLIVFAVMLILSFGLELQPITYANIVHEFRSDRGYHDVWRHNDGTWQYGIAPGDRVSNHKRTVTLPIDSNKTPKNFRVEFIGEENEVLQTLKEFTVNNGRVVSFEYLGNGAMEIITQTTLITWGEEGLGRDITQYDWQLPNVRGYRFYIPVKIIWEYEDANTPKFLMSTFNNYTINRQAPKNLHTFWMYYNSDSTDHFIVEIRSQKLTSGGWLEREIHPLREITFDSNKKLNIIGFNSDGTPIDVTVWRKGKERTDLSDTFKNQFFRGYTREQNGSTYYYYQHYQSTADGELYPTSQLSNYVPNGNILDYLSKFGLHSLEDYEHRIMNP